MWWNNNKIRILNKVLSWFKILLLLIKKFRTYCTNVIMFVGFLNMILGYMHSTDMFGKATTVNEKF